MTPSLENQIQAAIEKAAEKHCIEKEVCSQWRAFEDGANLLLPLLLKAIEQRDDITEQFWDGVVPNYIIEANNQELLEALNDQAK